MEKTGSRNSGKTNMTTTFEIFQFSVSMARREPALFWRETMSSFSTFKADRVLRKLRGGKNKLQKRFQL